MDKPLNIADPLDYDKILRASGPHSTRESEDMTIYDVLRHLINKANWDGMDFNEENQRKATATKIIDQLEQMQILGQIALNIKEEV